MRATVALATIDEELGALERDIRQLKIEYDQFFGGGRKRPPNEIEWRIDLIVKKYGERSGDMKFGQRFRYNNLTQTYAKYKDIFRRRRGQSNRSGTGAAAGRSQCALRHRRRGAIHFSHDLPGARTRTGKSREIISGVCGSEKRGGRRYRAFHSRRLHRIRSKKNQRPATAEKLQRSRVCCRDR